MSAVWPIKVVELLPGIYFPLQINIIFISEQLVEFFLINSMGSLHFTIESRGSLFNVGMLNS